MPKKILKNTSGKRKGSPIKRRNRLSGVTPPKKRTKFGTPPMTTQNPLRLLPNPGTQYLVPETSPRAADYTEPATKTLAMPAYPESYIYTKFSTGGVWMIHFVTIVVQLFFTGVIGVGRNHYSRIMDDTWTAIAWWSAIIMPMLVTIAFTYLVKKFYDYFVYMMFTLLWFVPFVWARYFNGTDDETSVTPTPIPTVETGTVA
tara:strand:- start:32 stop:637 length:606 start_codon:yes stop_codon:yes gene_type:complete